MALQPSAEDSCPQQCQSFDSVIVWLPELEVGPPHVSAGLCDRAHALSQLMLLANALCARLKVWAPEKLLSAGHNDHAPLSPDVWWSRYFDVDGGDAASPSPSMRGRLEPLDAWAPQLTLGPSRSPQEVEDAFERANASAWSRGVMQEARE